MRVLSLFDGMSGGQIALRELGIVPDVYYASELDKFAIGQTMLNFPFTIQLGDVTKWRDWDIDWCSIDLLLGGSPCQGFSFAGKQLAFDDPRSRLFFVFVEILNHIRIVNPSVKFLLENVDMKKDFLRIISEYVGIFPVNINSNLVSAQNRSRNYWSNIRVKEVGLFDELYTDIPLPEDEGILLKDILQDESDVGEKYWLSESATEGLLKHKARADANGWGFGSKLHGDNDKFNALKVGGSGKDDIYCVAQRGRGTNNEQRLEPQSGGKTNSLTTVGKDNLIMTTNYLQDNLNGHFSQSNRHYYEESKALTLGIGHAMANPQVMLDSFKLRRLTPMECSRLQTIPEWYKWGCSDTQQYRMLGNGWTIKVIRHILSFLHT